MAVRATFAGFASGESTAILGIEIGIEAGWHIEALCAACIPPPPKNRLPVRWPESRAMGARPGEA